MAPPLATFEGSQKRHMIKPELIISYVVVLLTRSEETDSVQVEVVRCDAQELLI